MSTQYPRRSFWSTTGGAWTVVGIVVGGVVLAVLGTVAMRALPTGQSGTSMDAELVSCRFVAGTATVGYTVTNGGSRTESATVRFEYRDSAGRRVDTDSGYVRDVAPGDTVRAEEVTLLDAAVDSGECLIVGVD
jgi:hypothetical protein